jgi:hypothetical protein
VGRQLLFDQFHHEVRDVYSLMATERSWPEAGFDSNKAAVTPVVV